jgi:protein TonB
VKTLSFSLILGITISLALFWFMHMMISNNQVGFKKTEPLHMTEFVRIKRETKLQKKERRVEEKPPPPENRPPPPTMQMQQVQVSQTNAPRMDMPNLDIPLQTNSFGGSVLTGLSMAVTAGPVQISTNVIPLMRIPPRYPMRAQTRRIEGWVKIEFIITEEGTVANAKVTESKPSKIFNSAALRAIKKWKFKTKVVDGIAVRQPAVQTLTFKLKK